MNELHELSLDELTQALATKKVSSVEVTAACLRRIESCQSLGAYLHVDGSGAQTQAAAADERRAHNRQRGHLDGVPIALKDIFLTLGLPTTCGSKILENFVAPYDATVVQRLRDAGIVLLGKLNMDEFAMGSSNEHSAFGPARNPWDASRVPGGSSGGSAVAVATGSCFGSLGTDTGGSIRQPAAFCGIVGLKPTYGRVSRFGVIAYASSLDQVGPMGRTVTDCAHLLQAVAGVDPRDSTAADVPVPDYLGSLGDGVRGLKIGIPKEYFAAGIDPEVLAAVQAAMGVYESLGAILVPLSLPHTEHGIATYYVLAPAEASSNLERYDGVRYGKRWDGGQGLLELYLQSRSQGFGPEVKRRIMLGTYVLSAGYYDAYYRRAQKARTLVRRDFEKAFEQVDVILTPTTPTPAFKLGENDTDPLKMYLADVFTVTANLAGLPGISLPCGFVGALPVGMQLLGPPFSEAKLLQTARSYEREQPWQHRRPA